MIRVLLAASLMTICAAVHADTVEDKAQLCAGCHGDNGKPVETNIPIIWGQHAGYLYLELRDFQKGARKDEQMSAVAASLPKEDLLALAQYFEAKPWPNLGQPAASKADSATADRVNKSIVCTSCHGDGYLGDSSVPRLADQQREYLVKTLADFRSRARANNPGMSDLVNSVSLDDLSAMAAYLAGL